MARMWALESRGSACVTWARCPHVSRLGPCTHETRLSVRHWGGPVHPEDFGEFLHGVWVGPQPPAPPCSRFPRLALTLHT